MSPTTWRWLAAGAAAVLLLLLATLVGVGFDPLTDLDHVVAGRAYDETFGHEGRVAFWDGVTSWGGPTTMRVAMVAGAVLLAVARRWSLAGWLVVLALVESVLAPAAKLVVARPRPHWDDPIITAGSTSFPSGHAAAAATAAVAALLVAHAMGRGPVTRLVLPALALVAAGAVGASRVFLGVHYASDVVGGWLLGTVLALLTFEAASWIAGRRKVTAPE
jgi:membrane-associated phospholipid phosphatase